MNDSKVIELYNWIDEVTTVIEQKLHDTYLDSLAISLEALFYGDVHEEMNDVLKGNIRKSLKKVNVDTFKTATIRKAIQLAVLKGMKKTTQHQHMMTPEAISLFIGYLADKLTKNRQEVRLFDPVSGTANLLLIVMSHLTQPVRAYASEIDPTLLKISLLNANLQKKRVEYFHQDSLKPLLLDPVDLVVADLPVGYYPDDVHASTFELKAPKGHSYSHHLLIEQSLTYTKEGGFLIFIIPESLFESEQAEQLHAFLQKNAHIIGLLQLPDTAFSSKDNKKSIFILQKKGPTTKDIKQPLLAVLPSFNDTKATENILVKINQWFANSNDLF
ncbi:class I SAM-dependent methyltransferase [Pseudogracilibacillus auburnensis]|uniref:Site-specific DNA-methyltransferase (Adenine-specific) n=1 Tax=Pseudogracilibacillus auburnensis TaxID=1494959 RepID=A0A2V3VTU4_9BACI|nr:class I SAM-dependent methyltransferase [Pseudogracilibacillus auburnensis]PXW85332.1 site-specific DNA-methyltransferase (adenine-specific) [Pseudogracilibacillus auburnensis]